MSIGDKEVYPLVSQTIEDRQDIRDKYHYGNSGLTYREWLIGMIASNKMVQQITYGDVPLTDKTWSLERTANAIIRQADAIINLLDKEV